MSVAEKSSEKVTSELKKQEWQFLDILEEKINNMEENVQNLDFLDHFRNETVFDKNEELLNFRSFTRFLSTNDKIFKKYKHKFYQRGNNTQIKEAKIPP